MIRDSKPVTITILDKEYLISCPEDERERLHAAAKLLNDKLMELKSTGKVIGTERMAVMTALNLASEMLSYKQQNTVYNDKVDSTIKRLYSKIDGVLGKSRELQL
jgi:cell division protein ZapA